MKKEVELLETIDGETLMDMQFPKSRFCIQSLLLQGVSILGGAPKIGKSWMVLDWCVRIAKGEEVWNLPTEKGTVLYLCLEDSLARIQDRLNCITDEVPSNLYVATKSESIEYALISNTSLIDDDKMTEFETIIDSIIETRLRKEITKGIQTIQYQTITLQTTNGQAPFITVFMYLNEAKNQQEKEDLALLIGEVLNQRINGVKNEKGGMN